MKERKRPRLDAAALWEYALRVLAGRAHSTGDLRQKLRGKAERAADVDPTIARLKEYGYLNDRKFAESFAAARLENEGLGKTRVLADLSRRRSDLTWTPPSRALRNTATSTIGSSRRALPRRAWKTKVWAKRACWRICRGGGWRRRWRNKASGKCMRMSTSRLWRKTSSGASFAWHPRRISSKTGSRWHRRIAG